MREIRFRAWVNVDWKMYDNHSVSISIGGTVFFLTIGGEWEEDDDRSRIELMQFTGLKDSKGVDIYEKDLVRDKDGSVWVIEYIEDDMSFYLQNPHDKSNLNTIEWLRHNDPNGAIIEVIGNLYQHPELINPQPQGK